jgi:hypothetical protein
VASSGRRREWVYGSLALGVAAFCAALLAADEILRFAYNVPGDSKPIVLHADEITTWVQGGSRIVLLKGKVLVEHGVVEARMQQAVAWIDQEGFRKTGILRVTLYAEGNVTLENGPENHAGARALIELSTRGELKLTAHSRKISQQPAANDPLFQRAQPIRASPPKTSAAGPVQQVSFLDVTPTQATVPPDQNQLPPQGPVGPPVLGPPVAAPVLPPVSPAPPANPPAAAASPLPTPAPPPAAQPGTIPSTGTPPAPGTPPALPAAPPSLAAAQPKLLSILPRTGTLIDFQNILLANGEHAIVVTNGVILVIRNPNNTPLVDIEADRLVFWTRKNPQQLFGNLASPQGQASRELEFYLAGNVEIRQQDAQGTRTLRADEVYYDVARNIAVAMRGDLEFHQPNIPDPIHMKGEELLELSPTLFKGIRVQLYASKLPSDPGFRVQVSDGTLEDKLVPKRSIFGIQVINRQTGQPEVEEERLFTGLNNWVRLDDIPVFWLPYIRGDAHDPLGPLSSISMGYNTIFGFQVYTTFNAYNLFGIDPYPGTTWKLYLDYLSLRGPQIGSTFDYVEKDLFGVPARVAGNVKAYGIYDTHTDNLGGPNLMGLPRGSEDHHPDERGWFLWRQNVQDLPEGFSIQSQIWALSDKNYLEQYFKSDYDNEINQETFVYVKQQQDNWAWTGLVQPGIQDWMTETAWLPRADGYLLGQSFLDIFTYNVHGSAGYAQMQPTHLPPPPVEITQLKDNTGRFDLIQELSAPFTLGPFRLVPYGVLDLTDYTEDLTGQERGRFYAAGGLRGSIPFTRLYPEVQSDLLNLNGINHKIIFAGNYYIAHSDTPYTQLPQLDPLNDDPTDEALRNIKPREQEFNPANGAFITTSPLFDPQIYAIRQLVLNRVDTLDNIEVFQGDIFQRLQTKRGYPGQQHIVDWMTLDLSGSFFPNPSENFGQSFSILQYNWIWNIGDQTQLYSSGMTYPAGEKGMSLFDFGTSFYRSDRTVVSVEYRQIDPLESRAINSSFSYVFSPKYAMTANISYDWGTGSQFNQLTVTRIGTDLQVSLGFYYDSVFKTFGVNFQVLPTILGPSQRNSSLATLDPTTFNRR